MSSMLNYCLGTCMCTNPHKQHIHKTTQTHTNNGNSIRNEMDRKVASLEGAHFWVYGNFDLISGMEKILLMPLKNNITYFASW